MTLDSYTQYLAKGEAFFGSDAGWYAVEVTTCDTIICGNHDGRGNEMPFATHDAAEAYRAHYLP